MTVIDPVTNLMTVGTYADVQAMLTRMIDHLKTENITAMLTSLMPGQTDIERTETTISSLMDTWIVLANDEVGDHTAAARAQVPRHGALERAVRVRADGSGTTHARRGRRPRGTSATPGTAAGKDAMAMQLLRPGPLTRICRAGLPATALRRGTDAEVGPGVQNLKQICEEHLQGRQIEIIDLLENPQLARGDQILAVPTLVRRLPEPIKKIIGDLSNTERVLVGLISGSASDRRWL